MRQVVLDTETTGLEPEQGHRVIEVGAVELVDRRLTGNRLQLYIDPQRDIDDAAFEIHGLDAAFLADKPRFAEVAEQFLGFVDGADLVIHNAPFDISFIDYELSLLEGRNTPESAISCAVTDSLGAGAQQASGSDKTAWTRYVGRYGVDNSARELHGAAARRRNPGRRLFGHDPAASYRCSATTTTGAQADDEQFARLPEAPSAHPRDVRQLRGVERPRSLLGRLGQRRQGRRSVAPPSRCLNRYSSQLTQIQPAMPIVMV